MTAKKTPYVTLVGGSTIPIWSKRTVATAVSALPTTHAVAAPTLAKILSDPAGAYRIGSIKRGKTTDVESDAVQVETIKHPDPKHFLLTSGWNNHQS